MALFLNCRLNGDYLLSVPDHIAKDIYHYQEEFDKWLYDRSNDHGYWQEVNDTSGHFFAVCYDGYEAFPRWLNEYVLKDSEEKAVCLPRLNF